MYNFSMLERFLVKENLVEAKERKELAFRVIDKVGELTKEEKGLFASYFLGYVLVQSSGYFQDYKKSPSWRILRFVPPVPSVVNAADLSARIGKELIDESVDYEYILGMGGQIPKREIRSLANLLAGVFSINDDEIGHPEDKLSKEKILEKCIKITMNWFDRPTNKLQDDLSG